VKRLPSKWHSRFRIRSRGKSSQRILNFGAAEGTFPILRSSDGLRRDVLFDDFPLERETASWTREFPPDTDRAPFLTPPETPEIPV